MSNGNEGRAVRPAPISLPATVQALLAQQRTKTVFSLLDEVHRIHLALFGQNEDYMRFLAAVYPESAVEGWLVLDDGEAARIVKQYAVDNDMPKVASENTAAIVKALRAVWRRFDIDRDFRAGRRVRKQKAGDEQAAE
jgi:hypothetical protein